MDDNNTVKYGSFFEIGIGLIVLATMGQIERNLQVALANDIPSKSPATFCSTYKLNKKTH